jgi:putative nucleotidyltransferase with HDIG domain/PAS domain S-box-containing protein
MTRNEIIYLIPYFAALALSLGVLFFAWSRQNARGAASFSRYMVGQTLWIAFFILGLISKNLAAKLFLDTLQWFAYIIIGVTLPVFVILYTEQKINSPKLIFGIIYTIPGLLGAALIGDIFFNWIHRSPKIIPLQYFSVLTYDSTPIIYGYAIYIYLLTVWLLYLLVRRIIQHHNFYQIQTLLVATGIFFSVFGTLLPLLDIRISPQYATTPFTGAIGNLLVILGFSQFGLFEINPIGRDKVFEALVEPVVILDNKNLIVDANTSMLELLGKKSREVIGESAKEIFADFPIPIKQYMQVSYARAEATFVVGNINVYYELIVWPLYNERKEMTGRIYISHDITVQKELERELRKLNSELEDRVRARTWDLAQAYDTTLEGWARALELRDKETEGHSRRVTEVTIKVARAMNITEEDIVHIRRGAILHDIGKMSVPDEILHKPGKLTDEEREIIKGHPETAYTLLSPIPFLKKALEIPYSHHEKWDGSGYPQGLKGEEIPLAARIFAVADVWDALGSDRCYNQAWSREKIISHLAEQSGKHFDPVIVNMFFSLVEKGEI